MKRFTVMLIAAVFIAASPIVAAQDLPKPEAIFAKNIEASGGAAAYAKIKNQVTNAKFAVPDMRMERTMVSTLVPPNSRATITLDAFSVVDTAVTDGVAWSVNPMEDAPTPLARPHHRSRHRRKHPGVSPSV